jgi:hypothetical protein
LCCSGQVSNSNGDPRVAVAAFEQVTNLPLGSGGLRCSCWSAACGAGCRWRRSGDARADVVSVDNGLGDVHLGLVKPEDGVALLAVLIKKEGKAIFLGILDGFAADLLGDLAVSFLKVALVGILGVFGVALESLLLDVDILHTLAAFLVGSVGGQGLKLFLEGLNLGGLSVDGGLFGLVLLLDGGGGYLSFVGGNDSLLEGNDGDLRRDGGGSGCGCGRSGCGGLSEEGGRGEASGERSGKKKGTIHAVV